MRVSWGVQRKVDGGRRLGAMPTYDLEGWEEISSTDTRIVFRPGGKAVAWSFAALILPSLIVGGLVSSLELPWNWGKSSGSVDAVLDEDQREELERQKQGMFDMLRKQMSDEEWSEFTSRLEQSEEQRRQRLGVERKRLRAAGLWLGFAVWTILLPILLLLIWIAVRFGLYDLLRVPIDRLEIRRADSEHLEIFRPSLLGRPPFRQRLDELSHLVIRVREEISGRPPMHHGWVWYIQLVPRGMSSAWRIEFSIERLHAGPQDPSKPPGRTRQFARNLQTLTGLPQA